MTAAILVGAILLFAVALAVGLRDWRWSIVGLLAYIPVSGIPIDAAYGHRLERAVALLAKDFLFVVPAYAGFALWAWRGRRRITFPGAPVTLLLALAALVVAQAFNPALPKPLVGLIGIKVWLFYVPLLFLGYHLLRTRGELFRLLGLMSVVAVVPAVIGLLEAALIYGGHANTVYRLYGDAAGAVTQGYVGFELPGGGHLRRIPSTFSSFYQYYLFLAVTIAVAYAWWRGRRRGTVENAIAAALWLLLVAASLLTGVRAAFFMTPLLIALVLALQGRDAVRFAVRWLLPASAAAVVLVMLVRGPDAFAVWSDVAGVARQEFWDVIVGSGKDAIALTTFGLGTGIDTIASRYAYADDNAWLETIFPLLGDLHESWYIRAFLELGIAGLIVVLALFGQIAWRALRVRLHDPGLRVAGAAFAAVLVWAMVYAIKGQFLDLDPLNVYFWLLAGLALKLPRLEEDVRRVEQPALAERARPAPPAVEAPVPGIRRVSVEGDGR